MRPYLTLPLSNGTYIFFRETFLLQRNSNHNTDKIQQHTHDYLPVKGMNTTWCMNPFIIYIKKKKKHVNEKQVL